MPDADLDFAANHLIAAGYGSAGQRCMAISVAVAVGDAGDELVERLRAKALSISVGPGLEPDSEMGPVVTAAARDRVVGYIGRGYADVVVDGREHSIASDGFWVGPTLIDNVTLDMEGLQGRDLRAGAGRHPRRDARRRDRPDQPQRLSPTASPSSPPPARPRASSSARSRSA